jgi:hypothetical protein
MLEYPFRTIQHDKIVAQDSLTFKLKGYLNAVDN